MRLVNPLSVQDLGPISCIVDTGPYGCVQQKKQLSKRFVLIGLCF